MELFTASRRSKSVLSKKKVIIWKGEMVPCGSGLISVKDREAADGLSQDGYNIHSGGDRCHQEWAEIFSIVTSGTERDNTINVVLYFFKIKASVRWKMGFL